MVFLLGIYLGRDRISGFNIFNENVTNHNKNFHHHFFRNKDLNSLHDLPFRNGHKKFH